MIISGLCLPWQEMAKAEGLWNLFLPAVSGLSQVDYALIAEETGKCFFAPEVFNCQAPGTMLSENVFSLIISAILTFLSLLMTRKLFLDKTTNICVYISALFQGWWDSAGVKALNIQLTLVCTLVLGVIPKHRAGSHLLKTTWFSLHPQTLQK